MEHVNLLLTVVFALMVVTNIVTEVLKKVTWDKLPTNLLVLIIAEALTLMSGAAYAQINSITVAWYHIVSAVIVGVFVSYAAMFGFDKLRQTFEQVTNK